jgi:hypothetical protein
MSGYEDFAIDEGSPEDEPDVADDALPTDEEEAAAPPPVDASYAAVSPDTEGA